MVTEAPADLTLAPLSGDAKSLREWVTNFHLVAFVVDPYTNESAWLLRTCERIMAIFQEADCRVAWLVTADADDAKAFLGPLATRFLTLLDPDRSVVKGLGLERLPAVVHISTDLSIAGKAEGWNPREWRAVADELTRVMSWGKAPVPDRGDPAPFAGSPALG